MEDLNLPSGKYSLISCIKSDEKGNVYLAEHKTMGVKRIIKSVTGTGAYREALMREAYILSKLKHPYIPAVCDTEETEEDFYIIEEYIEGQSLYDYIRGNGVFEQKRALETGMKLAKIIDFLHSDHSFKVCHLDIQPKNIIIKDGSIYLIDFGNSICSETTANSCVMATKGFAPPQQYMKGFGADIEGSVPADIYGFGAVLLYMLTGMYTESFNSSETERLLRERSINPRILSVIINALNSAKMSQENEWGQAAMNIICRQLDNASVECTNTVREESSYEKKPFIISVAGAQRGAGATYISLLLTMLLREKGINAIYEEGHDRDYVRGLAKAYGQMRYDKGFFMLKGIVMKPKYNENIHISTGSSVIVRDEGTVEECKKTGGCLVIVSQADILGWKKTGSLLESLFDKLHTEDKGLKEISVVLNRCSGEEYKKAAPYIRFADGYADFNVSPFGRYTQLSQTAFRGMGSMIEKLYAEIKKGEVAFEEKHRSGAWRGNTKYRYNFGKKG